MMASVVEVTRERERLLTFWGSRNLREWQFAASMILLQGCLVSVLPMAMRAKSDQIEDMIWLIPFLMTIWLILSLRDVFLRRRDRFAFERLQEQLVFRMETPTNLHTPSLYFQTLFPVAMISAVLLILSLGMARSAEYESSAVIVRLLFGGLCGFLLILFYVHDLWVAFKVFRERPMERLTVYDRGLLWGTGEKGCNVYVPWPLIKRAAWSCGTYQDSKTLMIWMPEANWEWRIHFKKIRAEEWERMLGMIGERVEVVREGNG